MKRAIVLVTIAFVLSTALGPASANADVGDITDSGNDNQYTGPAGNITGDTTTDNSVDNSTDSSINPTVTGCIAGEECMFGDDSASSTTGDDQATASATNGDDSATATGGAATGGSATATMAVTQLPLTATIRIRIAC